MSDYYMHIMDGQPAEFQDGHLVYSGKRVGKLATSLRQIRREQEADRKWYARRHNQTGCVYSYVRIKKP